MAACARTIIAAWLIALSPALDAAQGQAGHGQFAITYQVIRADGFEATNGKLDIGVTDTHTLNFDLDYHLTDRWSVSVGIPLVRKRYTGTFPHDPSVLVPPRDAPNIDDGQYRTDFQDWHLGLSYLAVDGRLRVEPFIALGVPSSDYPFFGHAAVGQNLWKFDVGASFSYAPGLSDAWYRADLAYVFVEETLGVSIDHWRLRLETGYFFNQAWSGRVFVLAKEGDGLDFPDDFPPPRTSEKWFQHDRMVKHNYVNAGLGVDWAFDERHRLSLTGLTMVHADQVHIVEYAFTLGLARSF